MNTFKTTTSLLMIISICFSLFGCAIKNNTAVDSLQIEQEDFTLTLASDTLDRESIFTNRDITAGYDNDVYIINLNDSTSVSKYDSVELEDNCVTIKDSGTYVINGSITDGQIIVDADDSDKVQLVLDNVNISNSSLASINVKQAKKVFITLAEDTESTLSATGEFTADNKANAVIYSKQDLTFNGTGKLTVNSDSGNAITSNDDIVFTSGEYIVNSSNNAIKANDTICFAGGTFNINAANDAIHCDKDELKSNVYIKNADITINADDDAIHAGGYLIIDGGKINIEKSNEGIEATAIEIFGGDISVTSTDDGINATSSSSTSEDFTPDDFKNMPQGEAFDVTNNKKQPHMNMQDKMGGMSDSDSDAYIYIKGGNITINADGDGIDSNGYIQIDGGSIRVYGPESTGNASIDYGISAKINGGELIAFGSSSMAQGFSNNSQQCSILLCFEKKLQTNSSFLRA